MKFRVIEAEKASIPIRRSCTLLNVSESGFMRGRVANPARDSVMTWCCWPMSGPSLSPATRPMAAPA